MGCHRLSCMMQSFHNIRSAKPQPFKMNEALLSRPKDTYSTSLVHVMTQRCVDSSFLSYLVLSRGHQQIPHDTFSFFSDSSSCSPTYSNLSLSLSLVGRLRLRLIHQVHRHHLIIRHASRIFGPTKPFLPLFNVTQ